jgi:hypothetical protein
MHRSTNVVLALVAGALLWANATESPLWREFGGGAPAGYGAVGEYLFTRGWPLSPWMFSIIHGMRAHLEDGVLWAVLLIDALIAFVVLFAVAYLMERPIRRRNHGEESAFQFTLAGLFLVIGLLTLPLTLGSYYLHGPEWVRLLVGPSPVGLGRSCLLVFSGIAVCLASMCYLWAIRGGATRGNSR